ncbi:hypothetical protein ACFMQL_00855 [Nonomuraea fastidiosa]|jgi:hypothetical protein|uniref:hypothetical protein n=1 Tax=Nonomuraea TaxID=83681 RepID=UPI00324511F7
MTNGARHALGVLAGLLLPPLLAAGLWYGVGELSLTAQRDFRLSWTGIVVLAASGILLALLLGSRLSPVASLLGGLAFTGLGALPFAEMATGVRLLPDGLLPSSLRSGFMTVTYSGLLFLLGVALLAVSTFPSRWRGRPQEADAYDGQWQSAPSPYLPPSTGLPEDATRPMYRE